MTPSERPTETVELEEETLEALSELEALDAETLSAVADYLEELAAWKADAESEDGDEEREYPEGVPEHASVSVEEVAGTEIRYYQWWEDEELKSVTERR